jgi:protein-disulfide isomerase
MTRYRPLIAALFALLLTAPAAVPALAQSFNESQRGEIERIVREYLLSHPELLQDVMNELDKRQAQAEAEKHRASVKEHSDAIFASPRQVTLGNPQGDVTIVEFFDYRCPYCKQVEPHLEALLKEDPKLRIVYKEFPVLGPESVYASRMALAARKQGKYAQFHDAMMAAKGKISEDTVLSVARSAGIDVARAKTDMAAPDIQEIIKRNYALADALDIQGTPAFIVGDTLVPGATDLDNLRHLIAEARKNSG